MGAPYHHPQVEGVHGGNHHGVAAPRSFQGVHLEVGPQGGPFRREGGTVALAFQAGGQGVLTGLFSDLDRQKNQRNVLLYRHEHLRCMCNTLVLVLCHIANSRDELNRSKIISQKFLGKMITKYPWLLMEFFWIYPSQVHSETILSVVFLAVG